VRPAPAYALPGVGLQGDTHTVVSMVPRLGICFVAQYAYGAMTGGRNGHIGGLEREVSLMARCLADRGQDVTLLTWDEGQPDGEIIDGVRVHTICRKKEGIKGVRFLSPRWSGLVRAMHRADADVYYFNSAECTTGQMAMYCRRARRKFIYSVATEPAGDHPSVLFDRLDIHSLPPLSRESFNGVAV